LQRREIVPDSNITTALQAGKADGLKNVSRRRSLEIDVDRRVWFVEYVSDR
jgi:hypothetical protein